MCSSGENNIALVRSLRPLVIITLFLPREHKIHIFLLPCNILYIFNGKKYVFFNHMYYINA